MYHVISITRGTPKSCPDTKSALLMLNEAVLEGI
jgi:hypothetical protein